MSKVVFSLNCDTEPVIHNLELKKIGCFRFFAQALDSTALQKKYPLSLCYIENFRLKIRQRWPEDETRYVQVIPRQPPSPETKRSTRENR